MSDGADGTEFTPTPVTDADYDEWLDAVAAGEGYALVCPDGHGSLPPRRICPECGSSSLSRESLADVGRVETFSVVHVPSPRFADDAPYVPAVVDLGPVRVTGVLRGVDLGGDGADSEGDGADSEGDGADSGGDGADIGASIDVGLSVGVGVEARETDGEPLVVFRPIDGAAGT